MLCRRHAPPCPVPRPLAPSSRRRAGVAACGEQGIQLAEDDPDYRGRADLRERCAGCHTLDVAGAEGSAVEGQRPRVQGRPELQPAQGGAATTSSTRSATAASRPARCRRTSSSARRPRRSPSSSPSTPGRRRSHARRHRAAQAPRGHDGSSRSRRGSRRGLASRAVLDLKAIRDDPEPVRAALARRRDGSDERLDRVLELDDRRRELLPEVEGIKAQQNAASQAIAAAKQAGEDAAEAIAAMQDVARRGARCARSSTACRRSSTRRSPRCPTRPTRPPPTRTRCCARSARPGAPAATTSSWPGALIDMEAGARVAGSRFAYLKGDLVLLELALVRWVLEVLRRQGVRAGRSRRCSCARRRSSARASCPTPSSRSTASPTTRSTWWGRARCRWPRCTPARCSTRDRLPAALRRASRRASGARPAPPAATRAASSACTSSTRSRCSRSWSPRTPRTSTSACSPIEEEILQALEHPLPRGQHRGRRPRRLGGQEVRPRGVAARPGALPRAHLDLEHDGLPGAAAGHPLPAARAAARATSPRSTGPRSRSGGR